MIPPIVTQRWLAEHPGCVLVDARAYFDGRVARDAYLAGHLPGAVFIEMEGELSGPASTAEGRHPLPTPEAFAAGLRRVGVDDDSVVVAYDDTGGTMAARLVWMLRMLGHDAALLDGGLAAWAGELETGLPQVDPGNSTAQEWPAEALASIDQAVAAQVLIDARSAARFLGEPSALDPVPGHIPGAISVPCTDNLTPELTFKTREELRERFAASGITDAGVVVSSCGSGVTACHNLLAMEYAGLGRGRLYPGSWSQYLGAGRPVELGPGRGRTDASVG